MRLIAFSADEFAALVDTEQRKAWMGFYPHYCLLIQRLNEIGDEETLSPLSLVQNTLFWMDGFRKSDNDLRLVPFSSVPKQLVASYAEVFAPYWIVSTNEKMITAAYPPTKHYLAAILAQNKWVKIKV